ncbi:MAG: cell division protein FtsL [Clostridia bacterium]|nr:cell division protein FtsL [Clostridia bacterium]
MRLRNPLRLVLVTLFVAYTLFSSVEMVVKIRHLGQELKIYEAQKANLLAEQQQLREEISRLNSDQGVEQLAREELKMVKPGERFVLTVVD